MMYLSKDIQAQAAAATTLAGVRGMVQKAIEIEHATIPLYLAGYFSTLKGPRMDAVPNQVAADIVRSVVIEEMLHFSIASNLLIALGGHPAIDGPDFVPEYPSKLPFGIGDGMTVDLKPLSKAQIRDVYMKIEEPEDGPINIHPAPMAFTAATAAAPMPAPVTYDTIGAFYNALIDKLNMLITQGVDPFAAPAGPQMLDRQWFPADELFEITDIDTATRAINIIVDQGEGTSKSPFEHGGDEPAHYYRFEEIVEGAKIDPNPGPDGTYHFSATDLVPFDPDQIVPFRANPSMKDYAPGTTSYARARRFAWGYSSLLRQLHATFNGQPQRISDVMAQMYQLRLWAIDCLQTPARYASGPTPAGEMTGLCFDYVADSKA